MFNNLRLEICQGVEIVLNGASPGGGGGGTRMVRGGIRLVHGLTKSTLIMYFSGMKIDPKYVFLNAFFLICLSCSFQNLYIWPKIHLFFPILHIFAPLNNVRAYSAWSWKTTLITWIFGRAWYPPWHSSAPQTPGEPVGFSTFFSNFNMEILVLQESLPFSYNWRQISQLKSVPFGRY